MMIAIADLRLSSLLRLFNPVPDLLATARAANIGSAATITRRSAQHHPWQPVAHCPNAEIRDGLRRTFAGED
jgi:hypothetical protein